MSAMRPSRRFAAALPALFLVAALMAIFPISKLMHAPGLFFSPALNQVDNPREARHVTAWAAAAPKPAKEA